MGAVSTYAAVATALYTIYHGEKSREQAKRASEKSREQAKAHQDKQNQMAMAQQAEQGVDIRNKNKEFNAPYLKTKGTEKNKGRVVRPGLSPKPSLMIGQSRGYQSGYNKQSA